jgi:hypothetical protein
MRITYTAADGRNFETEEECRDHEAFLTEKTDTILKEIQRHLLKEGIDGRETRQKIKQIREVFPLIEEIIKRSEGKGCLKEIANAIRLYLTVDETITERDEALNIEEIIEENGGVFFYNGNYN